MLQDIKQKPILAVHYAIVLFMCFIFPQLEPIGALTPAGMALVGGFLGAVWGWSMIDMLWPSFAGLLGMGWFLGFDKVAAAAFGNVTVINVLFMFVVMTCVTETGAVVWLIQKLLSMKFFAGKPWVTIGFFFYVAYLIAGLNSIIMAMILIPILKALFDTLGLEPYSKLPTLILIGVMYCLLMGQVTFPFMGVAFVLVSSYSAMFQTAIDFGSYLLFAVPLSVVMILVYLGVMKFVFRVDASPFKNFKPEMMGEAAPITKDQKKAFVVLICFIVAMLCSSISALGPAYQVMSRIGVMGIAVGAMFVTLLMKNTEGKPFINVAEPTQWSIILITALVQVLAANMMNPDYGVTATITMMITPLMSAFSNPYVLVAVVLFFAVVLTHFATNMVLCIVLMPFMVTISSAVGIAPIGMIVLLFFSCQMSLATPGGGAPVSAMFYGITEWVKTSTMSKLAIIAILFLFLGDVVFGLFWASVIF